MPLYEYEPLDHECFICEGKVAVLQSVNDDPCEFCPTCGLAVKRVISEVSWQRSRNSDPEKAAKKNFTTYKKAESGVYEKIAGEGPEVIRRDAVEKNMQKMDSES